MNYSLKNLSSVFTRQRLLAVLLVLNVVVSCLVICFSYGLYQNYNAIIDTGSQPRCMQLDIKAASGTTHYSEKYSSEYIDVSTSVITVGDTVDMLSSLSDDTGDNIELINLYHGFYNDIYCLDNHGEIISDTGIYENYFHIAVRDHALVCAGIDSGCISDEDYASGKKVVAVGYELFDPIKGFSINQARAKVLTDEKYVTIEGEQFELQRINGDMLRIKLHHLHKSFHKAVLSLSRNTTHKIDIDILEARSSRRLEGRNELVKVVYPSKHRECRIIRRLKTN